MIFNILFSLLSDVVIEPILSVLPEVTWSVDSGAMSYFIGILNSITYLLPMGHVITILSIIVSLMSFRILVALLRTVWDILPLV